MHLRRYWELADAAEVKHFFLVGIVVWTMIIVILALSVHYRLQKTAQEFARFEAVASFEKDLVYRRWAAAHGGVYVPVTEETPPNPYLAHVLDRDIATKSGRALTLINPAYMTRQVHELGKDNYGVQGHITSLNPLRPENAPDAWEAEALKAIDRGASEVSSVELIGGIPYMRMIRPLPVEEGCLKCHAHQGYKIGDIRGGISTSVPMAPFLLRTRQETGYSFLALFMLWFFGVTGLFVSSKRLVQRFEERRKTEEELRERKEQYRVLVEHAPEAIVLFDVDAYRVVEANANALRLFGCNREELMQEGGTRFYASHQPDGMPLEQSMSDHIERALGGEILTFERILSGAEGREIHCEVHLLRLPAAHRRLLRASYVDITEKKRLEEEARKLHKLEAVGILAGGIAHDFNNMLTAALGNISLAKMKSSHEDKAYAYLVQIEKILEQSRELGHRLLIFSKGGDPIRKPVQISAFLREAVERTLHEEHGISYDVSCSEDLPRVECDEGQIHQVIRNLLLNAKEAMPDGGRITVLCEKVSLDSGRALALPPGDYVSISVADEGKGIAEENIGRIFDPFYSTKEEYSQKGIGLGLTICHAILKKHEGLIAVQSKPGIGTTFHIYLPLKRTQP